MAARYWVGGGSSTNWSATGNTNWSATSGGANNASVPTTSDDVFFDANSGVGNSIISASIVIKSLDTTGYIGTITHNEFTLTILDNFKLSSGMTYTISGGANCKLTFSNTTFGNTITTFGKTIPVLTISGGGEWILQNNTTALNTLIDGAGGSRFNANNYNFSTTKFQSNIGSIVTMGSGTWTITGSSSPIIIDSGSTLNSNTSTLILSGVANNSKTVDFGGKTIHNLTLSANAGASHKYYFISDLTVTNNMIINGANKLNFTAASTVTVNNLTINTTSTDIVYLFGDNPLVTQWNLVGNGGIYGFSYLDITDSAASGGTWNNTDGVDNGNNTGWNFITSPVTAGSSFFSLTGKIKRVFKEILVKSYKPLSNFNHKY